MIGRRAVFAAAVPALAIITEPARAALPVPPGGRVAFRILRKGDEIGLHTLTFSRDGDALTVQITIDILVKFGPIPVYRYRHRGTERWRADRFVGMDSTTDHDGTPQRLRAEATAAGIAVDGSAGAAYIAPADALPTTYWNKAMLRVPLISSEDGKLLRLTVNDLGEDAVPVGADPRVPARRYGLRGDAPLDLWYDRAAQWAHLEFANKDGSTIVYVKQ